MAHEPSAPAASTVPPPDQLPADVKANLKVLVVDDDRTLREGCVSVLQGEGYRVTSSGRGDEAQKLVQQRQWDIVLCDLYMTPVSGMEILKSALEANPDTLFIVMTGNPSVASNIEALKAGAWDYLPKPFNAAHIQVMLGRAAHATQVSRSTRKWRADETAARGAPPESDTGSLLGVSPVFRKTLQLARRVAMTDASVMITGESGTGKEMFAQFIHQNSRRAARTLVPVNCAALPEPLLESELFGHRRGAFTGAERDKPGLLETANGGTFFLDELTEAPLSIQAKLLRVIQDGVVRRVGSEQQDAVVDVRFISATNRDPLEAVAQHRLREDLYFRLRVVPIRLPALRERPEDIPVLARHFLSRYWSRHRPSGQQEPTLRDDTLEFLSSRPWRGNVRELQNAMEHLSVLAEPGAAIRPMDLPSDLQAAEPVQGSAFRAELLRMDFHSAKDALVSEFEQAYLTELVQQAQGNMSRAARAAKVDRTTLYRLMEKHAMRRDEGEDE